MSSRGLLAIATCLALPGAAHGADWGEPIVLADNGFAGGLTALSSGGFLATSDPGTAENLRLTTLGTGAPPSHTDLSVATGDAQRIQVTAGDGTTLVAAAGFDAGATAGSVSLVLRSPDGTVTAPETLASGDLTGVLAAAGAADGTLAVAWTSHPHDRLVVRVRPPGGAFGPEQTVVDESALGEEARSVGAAALAFGSDGRLLVAARRSRDGDRFGVIELFERAPGAAGFARSELGRHRSDQTGAARGEIAVAAGAAGQVVSWTAANEGGPYLRHLDVIARRRPAGATAFASPERLARTDVDSSPSVDVAVLPDGRAAVLLAAGTPRTPREVSRPQAPRRILFAETATGLGTFAPAAAISRREAAGSAVRDDANPALAADAHGNLLAAWTSTCGLCDSKVMAALRPAGRAWSPPTAVNEPGLYASAPRVALDPAGQAAITWQDSHRLQNRRTGTTEAVAAIGSGLLTQPPEPGDRRGPRIRARVDATVSQILRRRRVPVRVTCSEACYARASYGDVGGSPGSGALLPAGTSRMLVVRLPRYAYSDTDLRRHVARGARLLRVTAGDAQGNLRQQRLRLTG